MINEELYSDSFTESFIRDVRDPLDCLIRFKEIMSPRGYIDANRLKETICQFIDDTGINFF